MRRREFIGLVGGVAVALPFSARAEQPATPVVAFVFQGAPGLTAAEARARNERFIEPVRRGLLEMGFADGRNVALEDHHVEGQLDRLPALVAELARRRVAVICAIANVLVLGIKSANADIPFVFVIGLDPVETGLVAALDRPGGNRTGVYFPVTALEPKRLELLRELVPQLRRVAALVNPNNPNATQHTKDLNAAAAGFQLEIIVLGARNAEEIDAAFATLAKQRADALLVTSDPTFDFERHRLVDLAARAAIPAIYPWRDFADAGGLVSYGNNLRDAARLAGVYAGRILKGDKPAELPVQVPTKFEFVINLKTAKVLGLMMPPTFLARADEVIE
jgi:putative tryptophan/tyrosine transport system substrate-binding protein